ncbi:transposase [Streptomyces chartreusis]|uniref:transposase n=1 Tax=Streptomyces chartreusis TaxID=1969 RepID=UPI00363FAD38
MPARSFSPGIPVRQLLAPEDGAFRLALVERGIPYVVGVRSDTAVLPEMATRTAPAWSGTGRKPLPRYRDKPVPVRDLVLAGGTSALHQVTWRPGSKGPLRSRFAARRTRPAGVRMRRAHPGADLPVCSLLAEWPAGEKEPTKYWPSTLDADAPLRRLERSAKIRWRIETVLDEPKTHQRGAGPRRPRARG